MESMLDREETKAAKARKGEIMKRAKEAFLKNAEHPYVQKCKSLCMKDLNWYGIEFFVLAPELMEWIVDYYTEISEDPVEEEVVPYHDYLEAFSSKWDPPQLRVLPFNHEDYIKARQTKAVIVDARRFHALLTAATFLRDCLENGAIGGGVSSVFWAQKAVRLLFGKPKHPRCIRLIGSSASAS